MEDNDSENITNLGQRVTTRLQELEDLVHSVAGNIQIEIPTDSTPQQIKSPRKVGHEDQILVNCIQSLHFKIEECLTIAETIYNKGPITKKSSIYDSNDHNVKVKKYQELIDAKTEDTKKLIYAESENAVKNIITISMAYADSSNVNKGIIDDKIRAECALLFDKGLPVNSLVDSLESLLDDEFINTLPKDDISIEIKRLHTLNELQINEYLKSRISGNILGHIVHRLLSYKYPRPPPPPGSNLPWLPVMALLLDFKDPDAVGELHELLRDTQVELVMLEDALETCIEAYRMEGPGIPLLESRDPPDCMEEPPTVSEADTLLPHALLTEMICGKKEESHYEKETQTGPEVMPTLSLAASLGKQALEVLRLQEQLSDWLKIAMLIEHLRSVSASGIVGWVLAGFPSSFEQVSLFETAISGQLVPNPDKNSKENLSKVTLHQSRIVCDPSATYGFDQPFKTTFTSVVSVLDFDPPQEPEFLDYVTLVQELYISQGVHYCFHCKNWTPENLKSLVDMLLITSQSSSSHLKRASDQHSAPEFTDFTIPEDLALSLASLWESLEIAYLTTLHRVYFRHRAQKQRRDKYILSVRQHFADFLSRPDNMQELIETFQENYINYPRAGDHDVQTEHHTSVEALQNSLCEVANLRRMEAENEAKEVARKPWLSRELGEILNISSCMMQLELDRFIDTMALLQDYFLASLESLPPDASKSLRFDIAKALSAEVTNEWSIALADLILSETKPESIPESFSNHLQTMLEGAKGYLEKIINGIRSSITKLVSAVKPKAAPSKKKQVVQKAKGKKNAPTVADVNPLENEAANKLISEKLKLLSEWLDACDSETELTVKRLELTCEQIEWEAEDLVKIIWADAYVIIRNAYEAQCKADIHSIATLCEFLHMAVEAGAKLDGPLTMPRKILYLQYLKYPHTVPEIASPVHRDVDIALKVKCLLDILKRIAPNGIILRSAFIYILQQATSSTQTCFVPSSWVNLSPQNIVNLVCEVTFSQHVDWRSFLFRMLNLSTATQRQLLIAKSNLEQSDQLDKGTVKRNCFSKIHFWFEEVFEHEEEKILTKNVIFDLFSNSSTYECMNYYEFLLSACHDPNPAFGFAKAVTVDTNSLVETGAEKEDDEAMDFLLSEVQVVFKTSNTITYETASKILLSGTAQYLTNEEKNSISDKLKQVFREVDEVSLTAEQRRARQRALATKAITQLDLEVVTIVPTIFLFKNSTFIDLVSPKYQTKFFDTLLKNLGDA